MLRFERWKVILVLLITILGVFYAAPNLAPPQTQAWLETLPTWMPSSTVNLGLDLRGGSYLLYEADTKAVINKRLDQMLDSSKAAMGKASPRINYTDSAVTGNSITFKLMHPAQDHDAAYKIVRALEQKADVALTDAGLVTVTLGPDAINDINAHTIEQSIEVVRHRIDESGTKEPIIQRQGSDRIVVELPGVNDPEGIKKLVGTTADMSFHLVDMDSATGTLSPMSQKLPMRDDPHQFIPVKKHAVLSGDMLVDSQPGFDQNGAPDVSFKFNGEGTRRFCDVTHENTGKPFAIVLDGAVISAPRINEPICGGSGIITGSFTVKDAHDLALLLRAGALPAPLKVVEERSVGPTLGSDSIASGKMAAGFALLAVLILMAGSYGLFGLFADVALVFNMIFIFAILSILQATLTLPGIAGIILTIGIAVDANVLVYERIREELRNGRTVLAAVDAGYVHARATIIDSNITTLTVALILFSFGSGPVKGFAVAMSIGIVTSLFAALMLTRLMVVTWLQRVKPKKLDI
jgi:preprotein translocase subunit SecD